jgi:hypothetical protein
MLIASVAVKRLTARVHQPVLKLNLQQRFPPAISLQPRIVKMVFGKTVLGKVLLNAVVSSCMGEVTV